MESTTDATKGRLGFTRDIPAGWSRLWLLMWATTTPALILSAFHVSFRAWVAAATIGFLVPELISITRQKDRLPPLTHTFRHFVPNWIAFPVIYASLGSIGANWLGFDDPLRIGALMGLLGWLTDHFTVTYAASDPFPGPGEETATEAGSTRIAT